MTAFSQEIFDKICVELSAGKSLRSICKQAKMPSAVSVHSWVGKDEALLKQYAQARETQADTLFDEMLDIADESTNDYMSRDGAQVVNPETINRSRLRIETRKWMAGKLKGRVYGEKLDHTSSDGTMTPQAPAPIDATLVQALVDKLTS